LERHSRYAIHHLAGDAGIAACELEKDGYYEKIQGLRHAYLRFVKSV